MQDRASQFRVQLAEVRRMVGGSMPVYEDFIDQSGLHPETYRHFECGFAARHIRAAKPERIVDIGSNRLFLAGLSAAFELTTVDVRGRGNLYVGETSVVADSSTLPFDDGSVDLLLSLNALEHFGLGRYGDAFDLEADSRAFAEWRRVVRPGGLIVFSTTISSCGDAIAFNAHRIYGYQRLRQFGAGMKCEEEAAFCNVRNATAAVTDLQTPVGRWDIYAACWRR